MNFTRMRGSPILVLHYNELWLKGCNRPFFVQKLREAVHSTTADLPVALSKHAHSRLLVRAETADAARRALTRLRRLPGIQYIGVGGSDRA